MTIKIIGRVLTASLKDRIITGLLLPYGEQGNTNVGKVTASARSVRIPAKVSDVHLDIEHDLTRPIATATSIKRTKDGLVASFAVLNTRAGDDALEEARAGVRACLSVEIDNPVIRAGAIVGGDLTGAGLVVKPAFPSARLVAADIGDLEEEDLDDEDEVIDDEDDLLDVEEQIDAGTPPETIDINGETYVLADPPAEEQEPKPVTAARRTPAKKPTATRRPGTLTASRGPSAQEVMTLLAGAGQEPNLLLAALTQVSQANVFDKAQVPQYLGEIWSGIDYEQEFAPLIGHADLTSAKIIGWRFKDGKTPKVSDWTGGGTQVPTNAVEAETVEKTASRIAAGWDVDRIYRDFPNPEFWAAFHRLSSESYKKTIDLKVLSFLTDAANAKTLEYDPATIPTGVSEAAAKIVKGAIALKNAQKGRATFAVLGMDLYEQWLYTRNEDALAYLTPNLGITEGELLSIQVVGTDQVPEGTARVGVRNVATLHELGGASPLRVSTEDIAKGNLTEALFGYWSIFRHDTTAIVDVVEDTTP